MRSEVPQSTGIISSVVTSARASTVQPAVMPLLNQLDERMADFHTRAQATTSPESAAELTRLAEHLAERKAEIMKRRQEAR
jgi:hypothetical protein